MFILSNDFTIHHSASRLQCTKKVIQLWHQQQNAQCIITQLVETVALKKIPEIRKNLIPTNDQTETKLMLGQYSLLHRCMT